MTTTNPIHTTRRGRVLEVRIERGKANAIDAATSRIMGDIFAAFAAAHRGLIEELDVNPLLVLPVGAVAVDALIRMRNE